MHSTYCLHSFDYKRYGWMSISLLHFIFIEAKFKFNVPLRKRFFLTNPLRDISAQQTQDYRKQLWCTDLHLMYYLNFKRKKRRYKNLFQKIFCVDSFYSLNMSILENDDVWFWLKIVLCKYYTFPTTNSMWYNLMQG